MTGPRADTSKADRALELADKGLDIPTIAQRLGIGRTTAWRLLRDARRAREIEIERAGKLADAMGHNV